eukprot:m.95618 g.95618  ORF g.95618 m.95618 type:complete len:118 (-) comp16608_c0_seq3:3754-4107(-)
MFATHSSNESNWAVDSGHVHVTCSRTITPLKAHARTDVNLLHHFEQQSSSAPPTAAPSDAPATVPIDFSFRKISETAGDFNVTFSEFESFGTSITSIGDFDGDDVNDIAASGTNLVY